MGTMSGEAIDSIGTFPSQLIRAVDQDHNSAVGDIPDSRRPVRHLGNTLG